MQIVHVIYLLIFIDKSRSFCGSECLIKKGTKVIFLREDSYKVVASQYSILSFPFADFLLIIADSNGVPLFIVGTAKATEPYPGRRTFHQSLFGQAHGLYWLSFCVGLERR